MKLKDCIMGILVKTNDGEIGHIVGLTYNVHVKYTGDLTMEDLEARTVPLVRFPDNTERGIHPNNLSLFK